MVKDGYDRLNETSYPLPPESIESFKKRFSDAKYQAISRPEVANGLEVVNIYRENIDRGIVIRVPSQELPSNA